MEGIGLPDAIEALRAELELAVGQAKDQDIQFPVKGIEIEFQVGVTRTGEGRAGLRFWVVELGGSLAHATESIQTLRVTLDQPVDRNGEPIRVTRSTHAKP